MFPLKHDSSKCVRLSVCPLPSWADAASRDPAHLPSVRPAVPVPVPGRPHVCDLALRQLDLCPRTCESFPSLALRSRSTLNRPRFVRLSTSLAPLLAEGVPDEKEPRRCHRWRPPGPLPRGGPASLCPQPGARRFPPPAGGAAGKGRDGNFGAVFIWISLSVGKSSVFSCIQRIFAFLFI